MCLSSKQKVQKIIFFRTKYELETLIEITESSDSFSELNIFVNLFLFEDDAVFVILRGDNLLNGEETPTTASQYESRVFCGKSQRAINGASVKAISFFLTQSCSVSQSKIMPLSAQDTFQAHVRNRTKAWDWKSGDPGSSSGSISS